MIMEEIVNVIELGLIDENSQIVRETDDTVVQQEF